MQNTTSSKEAIWNLPRHAFPHRGKTYWDIVKEAVPNKAPLDILEIGVYKAGLLRALSDRKDIVINSYSGIDPYLGNESDDYTGAYWSDSGESLSVYQQSLQLFQENGHTLHRTFSHKFYQENSKATWDVIIIDGDHRFHPALWDLHHWFKRVRPGGLLVADDYGNSDTPEVTKAVNSFIAKNEGNIARSGYKILPFQNKGKFVPISLTIVYFMKKENPRETEDWEFPIKYSTDVKVTTERPRKKLHGFSTCRFDENTNKLIARGWNLGIEITDVQVFVDENYVGIANFNLPRKDVFEKYPEYNETNSGWLLRTRISFAITDTSMVSVKVYSANKLEHVLTRQVEVLQLPVRTNPN